MEGYFSKTLNIAKKNNINILDAFIALKISEKYPGITIEEFENKCSEFKDMYLKDECMSLDDI